MRLPDSHTTVDVGGDIVGAGRILLLLYLAMAWTGAARADDQPLPLLRNMSLLADEPAHLDLAAGGYALFYSHHERNQDFAGNVTIRLGDKWNYIGPAAGVVANTDGGVFVYVGGYADIQWGPIVITPLFGVGADHHGDSHDEYLGGVFQFRLQLAARYPLADGSLIGIQLGHISSAHINKVNPGENEVMVSYAMPLRW